MSFVRTLRQELIRTAKQMKQSSNTFISTFGFFKSITGIFLCAFNYSAAGGSFLHLWIWSLIWLLCVCGFSIFLFLPFHFCPCFFFFPSHSFGFVRCYLWCCSITPMKLQAALMTSELFLSMTVPLPRCPCCCCCGRRWVLYGRRLVPASICCSLLKVMMFAWRFQNNFCN